MDIFSAFLWKGDFLAMAMELFLIMRVYEVTILMQGFAPCY